MKTLQPNFAGGIMSDGMLARSDLTKYQVGVRDAVNVIIRQQGGLTNRPGTAMVAGVDITGGGAPPTLIPFQFSADEAHMLEFHSGKFRVLLDGAYVLDGTVKDRTLTAISNASDPEWAVDTSGFAVGDLVYVTAPADNPISGQVALVTAVVGGGLKLRMASGKPLDTSAGVPGVANAKLSKVYSGDHPYAAADAAEVRYAQDADYLYMVHRDYPPFRLRRLGHANWVGENITFAPGIDRPFSTTVSRPVSAPSGVDPVFTSNAHGLSVGDVVVLQDAGGSSYSGRVFVVRQVVDANQVKLRLFEFGLPDTSGSAALSSTATLRVNAAGIIPGAGNYNENAVVESYKVAAATPAGEEGPASPTVTAFIDLTYRGNRVVVTWEPMPGAKRYVVYRESGGAYGYIGATENTYFVDDNIAPDTSQGPQEPRNPFDGAGNYPGVVAFHEQRLFMGGTKNDPQLVEGSQTANPLNFNVSYPPRDSDSLTFRPKHKQINAIRALVSSTALMVLTSGGEWALSGGGNEQQPLSPNNLFLRPVSYWGSADIEPALIGDVLILLQRGGKIARDYRLGGESPSDLTIMAADLLRDATIADWAYSQTPYSVLWVVLTNGDLLSMTYNAEHDIWGWTRHQIGGGGKVLQVATLLEGAEDVLYLVVERTRDGGGRYVVTERLTGRWDNEETRGEYLDGVRTITFQNPTNTATGLLSLAGETVTALIDGNVYHGVAVDKYGNASIGERVGSHWVVGLPYTAAVETLPVESESRDAGSSVGALRRATKVSLLVERTRGVWAGDAVTRMEQVKEWTDTGGQTLPLRTTAITVSIMGDWQTRPTIRVEQRDPLPFTLLAVAPDWEMGG